VYQSKYIMILIVPTENNNNSKLTMHDETGPISRPSVYHS